MTLENKTIGYGICGSFCTFESSIKALERLKATGAQIIPIMSEIAATTDTRFGLAEDFRNRIEQICQYPIIKTIADAEPIGPKRLLDAMVILPCTGNTLGKLTAGITDTPVTMAAKAHLRNERPLIIGVSTNDALSGSAKNIGFLLNTKNIYFMPMSQDDPIKKPRSVVALFDTLLPSLEEALAGRQIQPIYR